MKYSELFITTTDTVVGIGAPISDRNRELIFQIKNRPSWKKLIIMVGSLEQAMALNGWNNKAEALAKENWPGPVTLVINEDLAVRLPDSDGLRKLILSIGPIYMTSANISGEKQLNLDEAIEKFPEISKNYNFGACSGKPSTIIRVKDRKVLR